MIYTIEYYHDWGSRDPSRKRVQREILAENGVQPTVIGVKRQGTTDPGHCLSPKPWSAVHIIKHSGLYPERRGKYLKYYWQTYIEDT